MLDIREAFLFPFKDPNWIVKVLLGAVFTALSVVVIGIPVLFGYFIELIQRVQRSEQYPMPEWKDPGVKYIVGLKFLVTLIVYFLPLFVVLIPLVIMFALMTVVNPDIIEMLTETTAVGLAVLLILPYSLLMYFVMPFIAIQFAERESIRDGLRISTIYSAARAQWQNALIVALLVIGVRILAVLGLVFFLVGILATSFYAYLVAFHLYGQLGQHINSHKS